MATKIELVSLQLDSQFKTSFKKLYHSWSRQLLGDLSLWSRRRLDAFLVVSHDLPAESQGSGNSVMFSRVPISFLDVLNSGSIPYSLLK